MSETLRIRGRQFLRRPLPRRLLRWAGRAVAGVAVVVVVLRIVMAAHVAAGHGGARQAIVQASSGASGVRPHPMRDGRTVRVWIDSDAACGGTFIRDADDCFAVAEALTSPRLDVVGLSAVHGNAGLGETAPTLRALATELRRAGVAVPDVTSGAAGRHDLGRPTDASRALVQALERESLTVLALGPLTTVGTVLAERPDLAGRVEEVIAVGGRRPGEALHPTSHHGVVVVDLNVGADPDAVAAVLASGVPLTLAPFEASIQVRVTPADLAAIRTAGPVGRWLADRSGSWMRVWTETLGEPGFAPFDALAVGVLLDPAHLGCLTEGAVVRPDGGVVPQPALLVGGAQGRPVRYCAEVLPGYRPAMLRRILSAASARPPSR